MKPIKKTPLLQAVQKLAFFSEAFQTLKPVLSPDISETGRKLYLRRFVIKAGDRWKLIPEDQITCFFSRKKHCHLKSGGTEWVIPLTLQKVEEKADPRVFVRCHRSHLVSVSHIREIKPLGSGRLQLLLDDGTRLEVSRTHSPLIKSIFFGPKQPPTPRLP